MSSATQDELELRDGSHDITLGKSFSGTKTKGRDREYDFLYSVERVKCVLLQSKMM